MLNKASKVHGPQSEKTVFLPRADKFGNLLIDYMHWNNQWMWKVYWCDVNEAGQMQDTEVINENGTIDVNN